MDWDALRKAFPSDQQSREWVKPVTLFEAWMRLLFLPALAGLLAVVAMVPKGDDGDSFAHGWNYLVYAVLAIVIIWYIALIRLAARRRKQLNGVGVWTRTSQVVRAVTWFGINTAADRAKVPRRVAWVLSIVAIVVAISMAPQ